MTARPNIVLVHGAWADGSCWSGVIERLQADGYHVTAPQFPMTSLADDVWRIRAQRSDDLTAVGVAGDDGRAVLAGQHLAQPGNVSVQRGLRELGRGDVVAVGLQALDDRAPAGAVGPCAVNEDDIRMNTHE